MLNSRKCLLLTFVLMSLLQGLVRAESWLNWRGPNYDGSAKESKLPVEWSKTKNVKWKTPLPGAGYATPIVCEDRVFVTAQKDDESKELAAICISKDSGKILWQKSCGQGGDFSRNGSAAASPVVDGKNVYFSFANGLILAVTYDGKKLWERNLQRDYGTLTIKFGHSASPLLYKGKMYIAIIRGDGSNQMPTADNPEKNSYFMAIDPSDGKTLWKHARPSVAPRESQEGYTTPIPYEGKNGLEIVVTGGDCVTGHDGETGKELWRWTGYNDKNSKVCRIVSSSIMIGDLVIVPRPRHLITFAIKAGLRRDTVTADAVWTYPGGTDATTPLSYDGILYMLDGDRKEMMALDPKNGKELWKGKLPRGNVYRASPTASDGKIYCIDEGGNVVVLKAGKKFEVLSKIAMGDNGGVSRSSISIADRALYIRTAKNLYCIMK